MQKGTISVQTENIFPIIKQYLYSDQEIFLRELISNAVDATIKLKTLASRGEFKGELGDLTIEVVLNKTDKTIHIRDRGIGMTEEEVAKYLNQVAFSSASEFLEKYKTDGANIIGHFGLGFYSAFMVANKVEAITKSYREDAQGVTWSCDGSPEYTIEDNNKTDRGTEIVLHISDDAKEYLENQRIAQLLDKYCKFLPIPIKFGTKKEFEKEGETEKEIEVDNIINNTHPIWKKTPTDLTDEDYKNFYEELYPFSQPPMFWIHLNIDYPFNLNGILYFPKLNNSFEMQRNKIQLYANQVYVTDDVKDIVPEFLMLLHGIIDSPDIPLNVSRSYLQSDQNVKKITGYITKKVAEKLGDLFKKDRQAFESKWNDLGVFVKYGMISDEKFYEKATDFALLKNIDGHYFTIEEYKEKVKELQTDVHGKTVFLYTNNPAEHHSYISACQKKNYDVLVMDNVIDNHFINHLEYKLEKAAFARVDADTPDHLIQKEEKKESILNEKEEKQIKELFEKLSKTVNGSISLKPLSPDDQPVLITRPEFMRRMKEMQALQGMQFGDFQDSYSIIINTNHPLIAQKLAVDTDEDQRNALSKYLFDLALLNQGMLKGSDLTDFIQKSLNLVK